jgi:exosortase A-associated hydrolase 1
MGDSMRRTLSFDCGGVRLAATLDEAAGVTGLLIVSGGNEVRSGAHRGMAMLAAAVAAAGHPVMRFDRRGIGDSEGENGGFLASRDDIIAAIATFRAARPAMTGIVAFGNCDAASALALHQPLAVDALALANPWTIEAAEGTNDAPALPPAAAIKARYAQRLRDPASLLRLLRGQISLGKLARGIGAMLHPPHNITPDSLGQRVVAAIAAAPQPVTLLLASGDRTAQAFAEHWQHAATPKVAVHHRNSNSHSFAGEDAQWLAEQLLAVLGTAA